MFKQIKNFCWPYKKLLGWTLVALGTLLLIIFVPAVIWLALFGVLFVVAGLFLALT